MQGYVVACLNTGKSPKSTICPTHCRFNHFLPYIRRIPYHHIKPAILHNLRELPFPVEGIDPVSFLIHFRFGCGGSALFVRYTVEYPFNLGTV